MENSEVDLDLLMIEVLAVVRKFSLDPKFFALTLQISKEKFGTLSNQFPNHPPKFISISRGNEWNINFSPILEQNEYPDALKLRPDTFSAGVHKKKKAAKRK